MPAMIFSWVLSPKPASAATRPSLHALSSSGTDVTPSSLLSAAIFFGPRPGMLSISTRPGSTEAFRFSKKTSFPVACSSMILAAKASPMPLMESILPSATSFSNSSLSRASMALAPPEYARILNGFSPLSSIRVPISASISAISFLVIEAFQTARQASSTPEDG